MSVLGVAHCRLEPRRYKKDRGHFWPPGQNDVRSSCCSSYTPLPIPSAFSGIVSTEGLNSGIVSTEGLKKLKFRGLRSDGNQAEKRLAWLILIEYVDYLIN